MLATEERARDEIYRQNREEAPFIGGHKMWPLEEKMEEKKTAWQPGLAGRETDLAIEASDEKKQRTGEPAFPRPRSGLPDEMGREGSRAGRPACPRPGPAGQRAVGREAARSLRPRPGLGPARPARQAIFCLFLFSF